MSTVPALSKSAVSILLHHIDVAKDSCTEVAVSTASADLQVYLGDLLEEIDAKPQSREFVLPSDATQFASALKKFFADKSLVKPGSNGDAQELASRLKRVEVSAEKKYHHLKGDEADGLLNKGSFLQVLFSNPDGLHYLGVKIEHQHFLDEADFKRHIGIGESNKIYKACRVTFASDGRPISIRVFDTNSKIAKYWWEQFLDLKEKRSNSHNTATAVSEVVLALGPLKRRSPSDYTILRNATVAAFKRSGTMKFQEFVANTIESYEAENDDAAVKLKEIAGKIKNLPQAKNFDNQFELDPKSVPFKRVNTPLNKDIAVSYDEATINLSDKIWSSKTSSGKTVVVIEADEDAAKKFTFKVMG